jgi:oligopeptide transport system substrate-binding protein
MTTGRLPMMAFALALVVSCSEGGTSTTPTTQLAADQTLRVAVPAEYGLDPATIATDLGYSVAQNLYGGLYRFNERLQEVPDLAAAPPEMSGDGLVYRIKLRTDARFWDGRMVTAQDVIYSWNRSLDDPNAAYATIFQPVVGYQQVQDSLTNDERPPLLHGLTAPDPHTIVVQLSAPAGYFLTTLALPAAWVVDQAAIQAKGQDWSDTPNGAVGTGPFRMTSRVPGRSTTLVPVEQWWGGSTGWLKKVEIRVVPDVHAELRDYLAGRLDLIGFGGYGPRSDATFIGAELLADKSHAQEVHEFPYGRTDWLGFDLATGPFSGSLGIWGRRALSLAIDRTRLAKAVCAGGTLCSPATGGLISKGLAGYLGDGSDPLSRFDPASAKTDLQTWDPDGSKRQQLTYVYIASPLFRQIADNLSEQWKANLGLTVRLQGYITTTFQFDRLFGHFRMFRGSWAADYDNPQDWYDLFNPQVVDPSPAGSGYDDPNFNALESQADASLGAEADQRYAQAGKMLLGQAVVAPLIYFNRTVVSKSYVDGFGASSLYVYPLTDVKILQH